MLESCGLGSNLIVENRFPYARQGKPRLQTAPGMTSVKCTTFNRRQLRVCFEGDIGHIHGTVDGFRLESGKREQIER
jgi:hypothetical protein